MCGIFQSFLCVFVRGFSHKSAPGEPRAQLYQGRTVHGAS